MDKNIVIVALILIILIISGYSLYSYNELLNTFLKTQKMHTDIAKELSLRTKLDIAKLTDNCNSTICIEVTEIEVPSHVGRSIYYVIYNKHNCNMDVNIISPEIVNTPDNINVLANKKQLISMRLSAEEDTSFPISFKGSCDNITINETIFLNIKIID